MTNTSQVSKVERPRITTEGLFFSLVGLLALFEGKGGWAGWLAWSGGVSIVLVGTRTRPQWKRREMQLICAIMVFWTVRLLVRWL